MMFAASSRRAAWSEVLCDNRQYAPHHGNSAVIRPEGQCSIALHVSKAKPSFKAGSISQRSATEAGLSGTVSWRAIASPGHLAAG